MPEILESQKLKYSYPFGLGAYLLTGCFQYSGASISNNQNNKNTDYDYQDGDETSRQKRDTNETDMETFCSRYAVQESFEECKV